MSAIGSSQLVYALCAENGDDVRHVDTNGLAIGDETIGPDVRIVRGDCDAGLERAVV